jgi:hypothetical protein
LTEAERDTYRAEITRLNSELAKYVGHEPTIAEEMAYVRELNAELEERETRVREYWFPWPGDHLAGDHLGISVHTLDGKNWAIRVHYEFGGLYVLAAGRWQQVGDVPRAQAHCWTREKAEELAPQLAAEEAARFAPRPPKVSLIKELARVGEIALQAGREFAARVEVSA